MKLNTDIGRLVKGKKETYPTKKRMNLYFKVDRTTAPATAALYISFVVVVLVALSKVMILDPWLEVRGLEEQARQLEEENAALRRLVGCGRGITGVTPARVVARGVGGFTLACPDAAPGNAVLDAGGRYAGVVTRTDGDTCTVEFSAAAGLCGSYAGLVTPGQWVLTGLPADCALTAGDIVTTAGGDWLGTLDAAPAPDADGLTAQVPLTDTADLWGTVYFVKK